MRIINKNFSIDEENEYKKFFDENGFVVIRDVLTLEEVEATIDEIWNHPTILGENQSIKREDPETWDDDNWPTRGEGSRGFLSSSWEYNCLQVWLNRQNPFIYQAFKSIFKTDEILVQLGRYGMMRPTKNIQLLNGEIVDRPSWRTASNWLHVDQNPLYHPDFARVQGLICLSEHNELSGGFECVPGFHTKFAQWAKNLPEGYLKEGHTLVPIPSDDPIQNEVYKIMMPKGSLLIWDSRIPHCNYPNESNQFRIVQYLTYDKPNEEEIETRVKTFNLVGLESSENSFLNHLTDLGKKVLGIPSNFVVSSDPKDKEAVKIYKEAGDAEAKGDFEFASSLYRKAFKMSPKLAKIFGS